jgi:hypothetical protein
MQKIKLFMVVSLFLMCLIINAQHDYLQKARHDNPTRPAATEFNTLYFVLGTLSDYMGRPAYIDKEYQVDSYYYYEEPLVRSLDSLIKAELMIDVSETFINGRYETYSEELSEIINSFYQDGLIYSSLFDSAGQVCSFLTGRYYRYGEQLDDSVFKIQIPNSPNHMLIDTLLRRMDCTDIYLTHLKTLPAQFIYYFIPPAELKACFMNLSSRKKELEDEYKIAVMKILGPDKDYNEMLRIKNERDLSKVIEYFREN